ncbi:MAG: class I SAM-dependent methyltransferase [Chloroflexota bacterium]
MRAFWDRLNRRLMFNLLYQRRPTWDSGITPPELVDFVAHTPPGRALDLGCGTGTNAVYLAQHGWQASGVDFASPAIRQARARARRAGAAVDFRQGDVTRLESLAGPFDLVLDIGCYHALNPDGQAAYRRGLARLLAPGGAYLLYAFLAQPDNPSASLAAGLDDAHLHLLQDGLQLISRQDGGDRGRPSTWLRFRR